jgi:hypothetical protein
MFVQRLLAAAAFAVVAWGGVAGAAEAQRCDLGSTYPVSKVAQYQTDTDYGYTSVRQFRGAEVFVPAQPGLTREWLARTLQADITAGTCDFGVPNVKVDVVSAGAGFSVRLIAPNEAAAKQVYERAQQLVMR